MDYKQLYMQGWIVGVTLSERDMPEGPQAQKDVYRIGHSDGIVDRKGAIREAKRYSDLYTAQDELTSSGGTSATTLDRTFTNTPDLQAAYDVPGATINVDPLAVDIDPAKVMPLVIAHANGDELFVIQPNGAVYVRGLLVTEDANIVQGLRDAIKEMAS